MSGKRKGPTGLQRITPAPERKRGDRFNYEPLGESVAADLRTRAERIRAQYTNTVIEIGRELLSVKTRLQHGDFISWVKFECGLSPRTAQRMMQAADWAGDKGVTVSLLPPTILYDLSAPSTPVQVIEGVLKRLEAGEPVIPDVVKCEIASAKASARPAHQGAQQEQQAVEPGDVEPGSIENGLEALVQFLLEQVKDCFTLLDLTERAGFRPLALALQTKLGSSSREKSRTTQAQNEPLRFDQVWGAPGGAVSGEPNEGAPDPGLLQQEVISNSACEGREPAREEPAQ